MTLRLTSASRTCGRFRRPAGPTTSQGSCGSSPRATRRRAPRARSERSSRCGGSSASSSAGTATNPRHAPHFAIACPRTYGPLRAPSSKHSRSSRFTCSTTNARRRSPTGRCTGVLHLGWVPDGSGTYRGQMAVLVKPNGLLGKAYMELIKPFRHLIVYPGLIRQAGREWAAGAGYSASPGRMNWSSGTMQAFVVESRKRMPSAMSSGWIMSSFVDAVDPVGHRGGHEAGADRRHLDARLRQLLVRRLAEPDDAELRRRVGGEPALAELAGDRGGVGDQRLAVLGARLLQHRDALAHHEVDGAQVHVELHVELLRLVVLDRARRSQRRRC